LRIFHARAPGTYFVMLENGKVGKLL
jgi:hypothetical protein